jgi:hypothetical protein
MYPLLMLGLQAIFPNPATLRVTLIEEGIACRSIWGHPQSDFIVLGVGEYANDSFRTLRSTERKSTVLGQDTQHFVGFNYWGDALLESGYATNQAGKSYKYYSYWFNIGRYQVSLQEIMVRSGIRELNVRGTARFPAPVSGISLLSTDSKDSLIGFGGIAGSQSAFLVDAKANLTTLKLRGVPNDVVVTGIVKSTKNDVFYISTTREVGADGVLDLYSSASLRTPFVKVYRQHYRTQTSGSRPEYVPPYNSMAQTSDGAIFLTADGNLYRIQEVAGADRFDDDLGRQ